MDYLANISAFENLANNQNSMVFNDYTDDEYVEKATQPRSWIKRHPIMTALGSLGVSGAVLAGLLRSANGTDRVPLVPNKYQPAATAAVQKITTGMNAVPLTKYNVTQKDLDDTEQELNKSLDQLRATRQELSDSKQQVSDAHKTIAQLEEELRIKELALRFGRGMTGVERKMRQADINVLKRQIVALGGTLKDTQTKLDQANKDRDDLLIGTATKSDFDPDRDLPKGWDKDSSTDFFADVE